MNKLNLSYLVSYAAQQDYKNNPNNYDEGYYIAEVGFDWAKYGFKVGYEVLEGSGTSRSVVPDTAGYLARA